MTPSSWSTSASCPRQELYVRCRTAPEVAKAIRTMVIRGAPAIGVAAAMGIALGMRRSTANGTRQFAVEFQKICDLMAATRPTAVNLFWAIERMKRAFAAGAQAGESVEELAAPARARGQGDSRRGRGELPGHGRRSAPSWCRDGARVLTHCNAGALATAGYGQRPGVIRAAVEQGKKIAVFADETRPFLQGARLTAWELVRDGIDTTVITESMAGPLMRAGDDRPGRRRRGSHRGQRRHREQDRHLYRGGAGRRARICRSTWPRRCRPSICRRRTATTSRSRSGISARSPISGPRS